MQEILLLSYWEHFKAAKDLALVYPPEHPKRVAIESELRRLSELLNRHGGIPCINLTGWTFRSICVMYDWEAIHKQAIEIIDEKLIRKITYLIAELPCSERQFYEYMEREPQKAQEIREKLNEAKIKRKAKMIERWEESGNPTLEIAAFKLMADEEELEAITISKVKQESKLTFENLPKVTLTDAGNTGTENQDI